MKNMRLVPVIVFFNILFLLISAAGAGEKYIKINQDNIDILSAPRAAATVVCQGQKGDVFRLLGEKEDWYQVEMFSREGRYLRKSAARVTTFRASAPRESSKLKSIFSELFDAEMQAHTEALQTDPEGKTSIDHNLFSILADRYKLQALRKFSVQPPIYEQIRQEGTKLLNK